MGLRSDPRRGALVAVRPALFALAAALILFSYAPTLLTPAQLLTSGDGTRFFFPAFLWQRANLAALPMWTDALGGGFPLVAESQMAAFYPLQWLFLVMPDPVWGYNFYQLSHLLLGFGSAAYLLATLGAAPLPAAVGALAFALGGRVTGMLDHPNQPVVSAWLPLLYAFALRAARDRDRRAAYFGAITLALMLLAGHSQVVLIALLGLVPAVFFFAPAGQRLRRAGSTLLPLLVAGFALAGIQLAPFAELFCQSVRAGGFAFAATDGTNLSLLNLLTLAAPFVFGDNGAFWLKARYLSEVQLYCGMLPLLAVLATLTDRELRRRAATRFWWVFWALAFLLAMGGRTPLGPLLHHLPLFSALLVPARYALLCQLALAALAASGATRLLARPAALLPPAALVFAALVLPRIMLTAAPDALAGWLQPATLLTRPELVATLPRADAELAAALAWLGVALAALWFATGAVRRGQPHFAAGIVMLAVACDLAAFSRRLLLPDDAAPFFTRPRAATARVYHLPGSAEAIEQPNRLLAAGVEDFSVYTNLGLRAGKRFRPLLDAPLPAALALARLGELRLPRPETWNGCGYHPFMPLALVEATTPYTHRFDPPVPAKQVRLVMAASGRHNDDAVVRLTLTTPDGRRKEFVLVNGADFGVVREPEAGPEPPPVGRFKSQADFYVQYYGVSRELPATMPVQELIMEVMPGTTSPVVLAGLALADAATVTGLSYPELPGYRLSPDGFTAWPAAVLPKLLAPRRWQAMSPPDQAAAMRNPAFSPTDLAQTATPASGSRTRPVTVAVHADLPERHFFTITGEDPAFIVRLVAWYSAWECRIDAQVVPIRITNVMFQGVEIPAGTHAVEFIFRRTSLYLGLLMTLLGAVLVGAGLLLPRVRTGSAGSRSSNDPR